MIRLVCLLFGLIVATKCQPVFAQSPQNGATTPPGTAKPRQLAINNKPWTGDFDKMLERRVIRVYAPFSRSLYFNDKGRERGIAVELVRDWERYLNVKYAKQLGMRPLTIYIAPATRDKLLPYLGDGLADVAIGNLTVTEERLKVVDFVPGDEGRRTINEVVATGPKSPELKSLDDLSGKRVHVRQASSYYDSLLRLNERFKHDGKPEVQLILVPDGLEDEDMLGAGIAQAHGADRSGGSRRRKDRLGDPQGQSQAQVRDRRLFPQLGDEAGCGRLSDARLHEQGQGTQGPDGQRRIQALRANAIVVQKVRQPIRV
jgi:Bacterial extracellular solute-binding proteins, family 3